MIRERVMVGLTRAKADGMQLGERAAVVIVARGNWTTGGIKKFAAEIKLIRPRLERRSTLNSSVRRGGGRSGRFAISRGSRVSASNSSAKVVRGRNGVRQAVTTCCGARINLGQMVARLCSDARALPKGSPITLPSVLIELWIVSTYFSSRKSRELCL
jgi:hypothetical protein